MTDPPRLTIPNPVMDVVVALSKLGGPAWLVGEGLADVLRGQVPDAFQICAATPLESWLARFPHAVPTRPAEALVMIPTAAGPVEVSAPGNGKHVLEDLGRRCFRIHATAWNPVEDEWLDPFDGRADAQARLLRTVGDPTERLAEDPMRALRTARLAAQLGYRVDPGLGVALRSALHPLTPALRRRVRRELTPLLLSPGAGPGIELLRSTGLEEQLVPGARPDSGAVIAQLPPVLALRLAAWLRGTNAAGVLARMRFGRDLSMRVQRLLRHHPIDAATKPPLPVRALRRLDDDDVAALFLLRRAELSVAAGGRGELANPASLPARTELDRLEAEIGARRRAAAAAHTAGPLALGGEQVMQLLGCGPGPQIGSALRHLAKCVAHDPACNTEIDLTTRLKAWSQPQQAPNPNPQQNQD